LSPSMCAASGVLIGIGQNVLCCNGNVDRRGLYFRSD
jgi:hypothetical protein